MCTFTHNIANVISVMMALEPFERYMKWMSVTLLIFFNTSQISHDDTKFVLVLLYGEQFYETLHCVCSDTTNNSEQVWVDIVILY